MQQSWKDFPKEDLWKIWSNPSWASFKNEIIAITVTWQTGSTTSMQTFCSDELKVFLWGA